MGVKTSTKKTVKTSVEQKVFKRPADKVIPTRTIYSAYFKRPVDIIISVVALPVATLPMIIAAILVKTTSSGPIIFRQTRIGRDGKEFTIYKFRSMRIDAPHDSSPYEFKDADRYITKIGKILRKTSLDELPQIFNILKGDMSVVGPRPAGINDKYRIRLRKELGADKVRPGLTGWAQVNGRDLVTETKKALLDAEYVNNLTVIMDIKCMLKTGVILITRRGNVEGNEVPSAVTTQAIDSQQEVV